MKILNKKSNLLSYLEEISDQEVVIVSAFASGTERVVDLLLSRGNKLELLIGTINSFSSPDFFEYCANIETDSFSLSVDFGYQNSTHWKLYLIKPETVIIGSANFTNTGLSLSRDTCVVIEDRDLLERYTEELASIKASRNVVGCEQNRFHSDLEKYRESHRHMQSGRVRSIQASTGDEWLDEEENQLIPVFIWDSRHSKATIEDAHELLEEDSGEKPSSMLRDFFTYDSNESDLPYGQGDLVLCMNSNGAYADFYSFDRILHEDGLNYIYSYKQKRYARPFRLSSEIKSEIKNRVGDWYQREITELSRSEIQELIKSANKALHRTSR